MQIQHTTPNHHKLVEDELPQRRSTPPNVEVRPVPLREVSLVDQARNDVPSLYRFKAVKRKVYM